MECEPDGKVQEPLDEKGCNKVVFLFLYIFCGSSGFISNFFILNKMKKKNFKKLKIK